MFSFLRRYVLIFLVLWGGLAIWQSAGKVSDLRNKRMHTLILIEKTRAKLEYTRKKIKVTQMSGFMLLKDVITFSNYSTLKERATKLFDEYRSLQRDEEELQIRYDQLQENYVSVKGTPLSKDNDFHNFLKASLFILLAALGAVWSEALLATLGLLSATLAGKLLLFYGLAPWVEGLGSLHLSDSNTTLPQSTHSENDGEFGCKMLHIALRPDESISVRDETFCAGYSDSPQLTKDTHWIFSLRHPLMSILCGLTLMTRFRSAPESTVEHTLSISSDDPDEYFSKLFLREGERVLISPTDLVAFGSGIQISACWKLFSLPAWCLGQIRYYTLTGPGTVVVRSQGGITQLTVSPALPLIRKKHSLITSSSGVLLSARRTETLVPYILGRTDLFDLQLRGEGCVRLRNAQVVPATLVEKTFYTFLEGLGKLLGF